MTVNLCNIHNLMIMCHCLLLEKECLMRLKSLMMEIYLPQSLRPWSWMEQTDWCSCDCNFSLFFFNCFLDYGLWHFKLILGFFLLMFAKDVRFMAKVLIWFWLSSILFYFWVSSSILIEVCLSRLYAKFTCNMNYFISIQPLGFSGLARILILGQHIIVISIVVSLSLIFYSHQWFALSLLTFRNAI